MRRGLPAVLLFICSSAYGWGPHEHRAIAQAAQARLTNQALKNVRKIIGAVGLDKLSTCADSMLYVTGPYDCAGVFSIDGDPDKKTQPWHYISLPISANVTAGQVMTYCPDGKNCVVEQVRRQTAVLSNPAALQLDKQKALMFLVHVVGDQHQPLHNAEDNDIGGNKKRVEFMGVKKNLHSLWDDMITSEDWRTREAKDSAPLAAELAALVGQNDPTEWTKDDFITQTSLESYGVAKDEIHPQYAKDRGQNLGEDYQKKMQPIAKKRMAMAAVRLAHLIEQALGQP